MRRQARSLHALPTTWRASLLRNVHPWDTCTDGAQQIGSYRTDAASHEVGGMNMVAVTSVNRTHVAGLHCLDVGNVDHGYVHRDDSHDWGELSVNQHATLVT